MTATMLAAGLCLSLSSVLPMAHAGAAAARAEAKADAANPMADVIAQRAAALVTVKFVMVAGENERESEAGGIVIDPSGLILVSNFEMGGAPRGRESAQAKDIKILIGDDTQGLDAKVIGRDSELELAWIQLDKAPEKPLASITLPASGAAAAKVMPGQTLIGLDRMNKYFDRTVVGFKVDVGGVTRKPRDLIVPSGGNIAWIGLPMFTTDATFAGVSVVQMIGGDDEDMDMRSVGRVSGFDRAFKILPATTIAEATTRAVEAHKAGKNLGAEEPKKPADKPADAPADDMSGDKPSEPKP
jgi:S1-C subfamily serine protease